MARLHEYQGKALLKEAGISVPRGLVVRSPEEAEEALLDLGGRAVIKIQAWVASRRAFGGVQVVNTPQEARDTARGMLELVFEELPVRELLVEEPINIVDEISLSLPSRDAGHEPALLFGVKGGSRLQGPADSADRIPFDHLEGIDQEALSEVVRSSRLDTDFHEPVIEAIGLIEQLARTLEASTLEIDPLATTVEGSVVAADCRMTIGNSDIARLLGNRTGW